VSNGRNITGSGINSGIDGVNNPYAGERRTKFPRSGANSLTVGVNLDGLDALLAGLADDAAKAVRPAAQAAAQVLYDAVKSNVARINRKTGLLEKSIYQVYSKSNSTPFKKATYHVSWNARTAPHGGLVEYGHLQRYRYYKDNQGRIRPMVRPGMDGKPRPGRNASQAAKDAYYVPLPQPVQVAARPFIRPAIDKFDAAAKAAEAVLISRLMGNAG
jgi:hypothetical protein